MCASEREGQKGRERKSQADFMPSAETEVGLDLAIELISGVRC